MLGGAVPGAPLQEYSVVDLSTGIAGAYCTKILADGGADVVKVEDPDGDWLRGWNACGADRGQRCRRVVPGERRGRRSEIPADGAAGRGPACRGLRDHAVRADRPLGRSAGQRGHPAGDGRLADDTR